MEFVSRSEIIVPVDAMGALVRAFAERARLGETHPGFVGLELLRDVRDNGRYVLLTRWSSRAHFVAYMKSGDHKRAHERSHDGLAGIDLGGGRLEQFHVVHRGAHP